MQIQVRGASFFSDMDEDMLFAWLEAIKAIRSISGAGDDLILDIDPDALCREDALELVAIFARYGLALKALRPLAEDGRFHFLNDPDAYWYNVMFDAGMKNIHAH